MSEEANAGDAGNPNHISTVRRLLLDQMQALRGASKPEDIQQEIDRSKGMADLAQAVVNTAKVEVDYLKLTNQTSTPFLEAPPDKPYLPEASGSQGLGSAVTRLPGPGNGIESITRHACR